MLFATNAYGDDSSPQIEIICKNAVLNYSHKKLYLNGEPTDVETNADGQAKLTFSEPGTYQLSAVTENKRLVTPYSYIEITADDTLIGDADRSGDLTILDATHIQRWLAVLVDDEEIDLEAADADRSGDVTILDATAIQRWLAGIIPAL